MFAPTVPVYTYGKLFYSGLDIVYALFNIDNNNIASLNFPRFASRLSRPLSPSFHDTSFAKYIILVGASIEDESSW